MTWQKICAGGKMPKNGEKVLATDGIIWCESYFHRGSLDAFWFDTIDLETESITHWARISLPGGKNE